MTPETFNLLLGLFLGFLFSLSSLLITTKIQSDRDRKLRLWDIEDKRKEAKKEIVFQRLNQLEEFIKDYGRKISIFECLIHPGTKIDDILKEEKNTRFPKWNENLYLFSLLPYFNDHKLTDSIYELGMSLSKITNVYFEFSVNEKIAMEAAAGASFCGLRSLVACSYSRSVGEMPCPSSDP